MLRWLAFLLPLSTFGLTQDLEHDDHYIVASMPDKSNFILAHPLSGSGYRAVLNGLKLFSFGIAENGEIIKIFRWID